eukprot:CAMPEP_0197840440 /NCGR_PEP_ID=MMETSP1437-20131217/45613_1 /TAXON_ID=49252 ORGANISM="Eucampia antarctica, Strain CCMP1452" /NCGR_SAMPLE_ID=MMETSP1437 /ASSEMBLY_ACC=CAM_ASM_001096 /LENGTH=343 /DNA_ID=CAMNT_0043450057 /DNA_START=37 /DNA_END=1069 /DNA_ORIENTATION=+
MAFYKKKNDSTSYLGIVQIFIFILMTTVGVEGRKEGQLAFAYKATSPPPPPISMPVWSLACPLVGTGDTSMNIVTLATPVSISSPGLWTISLNKSNNLTREAFLGSGVAIMQLLTPAQKDLVPILGQRGDYEQNSSKRNALAQSTIPGFLPTTKLKTLKMSIMYWMYCLDVLVGTGDTSMNVATFVAPVSVDSPKFWTVSLYADTLTKEAFLGSGVAILQLLTPAQKDLVPILGQRTGHDKAFSKRNACGAINYPWISTHHKTGNADNEFLAVDVLPRCASYIKLNLLQIMNAGDHEVALCAVAMTGEWDENFGQVRLTIPSDDYTPIPKDQTNTLYTASLRQ